MTRTLRLIAGVVVACVSATAIAAVSFWLLRRLWPGYAAAEPEKAYTLGMLFARLSLGVLITGGAACVAAMVAGARAAWWFGAVLLAVSLPTHLYTVWADYPVWYHFVYLAYLMPVAVLAPRLLEVALNERWPSGAAPLAR